MRRAVTARGFVTIGDDSLLSLARRFDTPVRHRRSLANSRILVSDAVTPDAVSPGEASPPRPRPDRYVADQTGG